MEKVRCADCGLLGSRLTNAREIIETEERHREKWTPGNNYQTYPICLAMVISFRKESEKGEGDTNEKVTREIKKERECQKHVAWKLGFSPKEHAEMQADLELRKWQAEREEADRRFEEHRREQDRAWQQKCEEDNREFQRRLKESTDAAQAREHRLNRRTTIAGSLVGVVLGALLGWFLRPSTPEQKQPVINSQLPGKQADSLIQK